MVKYPPQIQAVFFDIDGTLVSFKTHSVPLSAKEAIQQLKHNGIKVIIATGRALCDINNLGDLEFDGFITANGACCIDSNGEIIERHLIPKENLKKLALYLQEKPFPCSFITEQGNFINYVDDLILSLSTLINLPLPTVKPVPEILTRDIFQLDAYVDLERETELLTHVLTDCISCRWHPYFTDINVNVCNKATGMDRFLTYFGIEKEHSMAFGDGGNDIAMLKHAAIGIAMGNAKDHVKTAANYVTSSVDEDGIINALKHFAIF